MDNKRERLLPVTSPDSEPAQQPSPKEQRCRAWLCDNEVYGMGVCKMHYEEWDMESVAMGGPQPKEKRSPRKAGKR